MSKPLYVFDMDETLINADCAMIWNAFLVEKGIFLVHLQLCFSPLQMGSMLALLGGGFIKECFPPCYFSFPFAQLSFSPGGLCLLIIQLQLKLFQLNLLHIYLRSLSSCFLVSFSYLLPLGNKLSMLLGVMVLLAWIEGLQSLSLLPRRALVFLQKFRVEDPAQGISQGAGRLCSSKCHS